MKNNMDLNLLVVFSALAMERNTTKAAKLVGLSQPAISHALKRLREAFSDPLFVRAARGLVPTKRALELIDPINKILDDAQAVLKKRAEFDPRTEERIFRIATTELFELVVLPGLLKKIQEQAPHIQLICRPLLGELPKEDLEGGHFDLAIAGYFGVMPEGYYQQELFRDDFVCVGKKNHPSFKKGLSLEKYAEAHHVLISLQGDMKSKTQAILKKHGFTQHFTAGLNSFASPGWILCESNFLLTCPRRLAQAFKHHLPVDVAELPFPMKEISVVQVWHARNHKNEAHAWLRGLIKEVMR